MRFDLQNRTLWSGRNVKYQQQRQDCNTDVAVWLEMSVVTCCLNCGYMWN